MAFSFPHIFGQLSGQVQTGYLDDNFNAAIGALQSATANSAPDTGTANAYACALSPAPSALVAGMQVTLQNVIASNTGAATFNLNGLGALPINGANGLALVGGIVVAGSYVTLMLNASKSTWIIVSQTAGTWPVKTAVTLLDNPANAALPVTTASDNATLLQQARDTLKAIQAGGASMNFAAMPQVGGSPIVESGSNANGSWVKYADGTVHLARFNAAVTSDASGFGSITWILPAACVNPPVSFASSRFSGGTMIPGSPQLYINTPASSSSSVTVAFSSATASATGNIDIFASGKWK